MMKHVLINILFGIFSIIGFSQQAIGGTGGDAKNSNGSFSYSAGQLIVTQVNPTSMLFGDEAITLNHGVQQYFIANCITNKKVQIIASPNPSRGLVNIDLINWDRINVELIVSDLLGRVVWSETLKSNKTQLDLSQFSSALYFLTITNVCGSFTTFKLILDKK